MKRAFVIQVSSKSLCKAFRFVISMEEVQETTPQFKATVFSFVWFGKYKCKQFGWQTRIKMSIGFSIGD
jgi:hypothetical protein